MEDHAGENGDPPEGDHRHGFDHSLIFHSSKKFLSRKKAAQI
jgi:hypothetical protein